MNEAKKNQLRNVLIAGEINVEKYELIKDEIFKECHMQRNEHKDRALWSSWINGKSVPNRFCQCSIDNVLTRFEINPIYD